MFRPSHTIRQGVRLLGRPRGVAIAAVLSLGVGVNIALFAVVHAVLVRPLPHPEPDRLVSIFSRDLKEGRDHQMAPLDFFDYERQSSSFERIAAYYPPGFTLTGGVAAERVPGARASSGIFDVLGVRPIYGRGFLPAEDKAGTARVAVIAHGLWARRFQSDPAIVGRSITLSGNPYIVVGVLPEGFDSPAIWPRMPEVWVPIGLDANVESRDARMLRVLGRMRAGVAIDTARSDMERIASGLGETYPELADTGVTVTPLLEELTREIRPSLLMLSAGVIALLLVSIGNAAGLIMGGTLSRRYEFATRLALGASRRQLVAQVVGEHVVLGAAGALVGFGMAYLASDILVDVATVAGVPRANEIRVGALALTAGVVLSLSCATACAAIAGASIVRRAANWRIASNLRLATPSGLRTATALLALEAAFSLALLTGAMLLTRSVRALEAVDPGFDAEQTYTLRLSPPAARYPAGPVLSGFYDRVVERVRALPGVAEAAVVDWLPASGAGSMVRFTIGGSRSGSQLAELRIVGDAYFETLGVRVVAGRAFDTRDRDGALRAVMVNESFARAHFPAGDAVGRQLVFERGEPFTAEIVGVTGDVREVSRRLAPAPGVYAPKTQMPWMMAETRDLVVRLAAGQPPPSTAVQAIVREIEPDAPVAPLVPLAEVTSVSIERAGLYSTAVTAFAAIAVLLAAFGVYGAVSAIVAQGTRQIGICIALGATSLRVVRETIGRGIAPAVVGLVAGVPLALGAGRLVRQQLFGVEPYDGTTLIAVLAVMLLVAVAAALVPALRAARIDPARTLRHESM